jgi:CubicO group peptidase (beta-lactamase class C family)
MTNTVAYEKGRNEVAHRAYGYTKEGGAWTETDQSPTSATLGDGGIYSSLRDLAKWHRALDEYRLLSAKEMAPAWTPVDLPPGSIEFDGVATGYGFGWALDTLDGYRRIWHSGDTVGFRANVQRFPQKRLTVVVLENRTEPLPRPLATRLAEMYLH